MPAPHASSSRQDVRQDLPFAAAVVSGVAHQLVHEFQNFLLACRHSLWWKFDDFAHELNISQSREEEKEAHFHLFSSKLVLIARNQPGKLPIRRG